MNGLSKLRFIGMLIATFILAGALLGVAGAYTLAWCQHAGDLRSNHFVTEKYGLNIVRECDTDDCDSQDSDPSCSLDHSEACLHLTFSHHSAALRRTSPSLAGFEISMAPQAHVIKDPPQVYPAERLFSFQSAMAISLPNAKITALRTIVLQN